MANSEHFAGKVALITGSSSGIGAQTAIKLSKLGALVVITGRSSDNISQIAKQCLSVSPNNSKPLEIVADLTIDEDCKRLVETTIQTLNKLDILVNNAGAGTITTFSDPNFIKAFDSIININLRSVILVTQLAVKHLELTKGVIINMSSVLAIKPRSAQMPYCMAKSALDMFTKCLSLELGPKGIRVNSINPAVVKTNFDQSMGLSKDVIEAKRDQRAKQYPIGRIGEAEDIANAVAFLASNEASFINGVSLIADGGFLNI